MPSIAAGKVSFCPSVACTKPLAHKPRCSSPGKSARALPTIVAEDVKEPLMVRAARGEEIERVPAWMMRQAGRYQKAYRDLAEKHPSFRERSETTDLIVEISLQPWESFKPDGVILFSDILTPLPAFGLPFEIDDYKGPLMDQTITCQEDLKMLKPIELDTLSFVGDALSTLRNEVDQQAAVLGFIGAPWTLATYIVEGKSTNTYKTIKRMTVENPSVLKALLEHLAEQLGEYVNYQIESGADYVQIFDSWGGQLPPHMWDQWSKPYIDRIVQIVRAKHPRTPLMLYANGSGGILERMGQVAVDVVGLDWTIDMADARQRLGDKHVQGNVDPVVLFSTPEAVEEALLTVVKKAGPTGHILNLGHGVMTQTPEENVKHFFDVAKVTRPGAP
mmetsp:Transcript_13005/g.47528  ORF Transcript_13005/g.47528 Transcript_13005/m.47528 type:complete len:390 (-) Transcript_13005:1964-3133(-)